MLGLKPHPAVLDIEVAMTRKEEKPDTALGSTKLATHLPFTSLRNQSHYSATQNYGSNKSAIAFVRRPNLAQCFGLLYKLSGQMPRQEVD